MYASGTAVARLGASRPDGETGTAESVVRAARTGDQRAAGVLRRAGEAVGRAVACLVPVFNPDLVLLGGGLAAGAGRLLLDPAQRALAGALPLSSIIPAPPVRLATCGPAAGAIGATYLHGMISKSATGVSA